MWPSVRKGEEENIFPFQEEADAMFNSALVYELAVLKQYAQPLLFAIPKDSEGWRPNGSLNSWTTLSASAARIFKEFHSQGVYRRELPERVMSADRH